MTTTIETFLADIRYFSALDPYNWQVDNRPLSDLEDSINTLASGLESAINASKLNALVAGLIHQTIVGRGRSTGYAFQPSNLVWRIERSITNGWITDDGKEVATIAVQVTPQNFVFSAPSAGQKKLILIKAIYEVPNDTDLPYYDETQTLDAASTGFNSLVSKVGVATLSVVTNTVALTGPDNYPSTSPGEIPLFHIRIDAGDTTLNKVYYVNFTGEGQPIRYATQYDGGQARFANSQEVIDRSTTTIATPSDSAVIAVDEMANIGLGNGLEALFKDRYFLDLSDNINAIHTIPGSPMNWLGKRAWFSGTTPGTLPFPGGIIEGDITSVAEQSPGSGIYVVLSARQMATSFDGKLMATRTYQNPSWNPWTIFGSRTGDELVSFKVGTAVSGNDAVNLNQLRGSLTFMGDSYVHVPNSASILVPPGVTYRMVVIGGGGGAAGYETGNGGAGGDSYLTIDGFEVCRAYGGLGALAGYGTGTTPNPRFLGDRARGNTSFNPQFASKCIMISKSDPELIKLAGYSGYGNRGTRSPSHENATNTTSNVYGAGRPGSGGCMEFLIRNTSLTSDMTIVAYVGVGGTKTDANLDATNGTAGTVAVLVL